MVLLNAVKKMELIEMFSFLTINSICLVIFRLIKDDFSLKTICFEDKVLKLKWVDRYFFQNILEFLFNIL